MLITAAGSLPGTDFRGSLQAMSEALPGLLPWPELPVRGIESAIVGRALGLIEGLAFDVQPAGWRLTHHSGPEHRRAQALWRRDLDDAEELLQDFDGVLKVAVAGPWTLAAMVERPAGDKLLADHGARRELAQALAEGREQLATTLARRLPHVTIQWQLDEPAAVAVRSGTVPTASGFSKHRSVSDQEIVEAWKTAGATILHCCAEGSWLDLAATSGFQAAYVDARLTGIDDLGIWLDTGRKLVLGVVDTNQPPQHTDRVLDAARRVTREVGVSDSIILAPACGFAGWRVDDVLRQLESLRAAADLLDQDRR